jgi:hypothetical protein
MPVRYVHEFLYVCQKIILVQYVYEFLKLLGKRLFLFDMFMSFYECAILKLQGKRLYLFDIYVHDFLQVCQQIILSLKDSLKH